MIDNYTKQQYLAEITLLWNEVVTFVYKKQPTSTINQFEEAWEHTTMTPLQYIKFVADPKNATNRIQHGQKAREHRWIQWLKKNETNHRQLTADKQ